MPSGTTVNISEIIRLAQLELGGYSNKFSNQDLLAFLNEAKDRIWSLIKELDANYFIQTSQSTDNTQLNYFPPLTVSTRSYALPGDCHEPRFIEITSLGYENTRFFYRDITHPDFTNQRREATATGPSSASFASISGTYFYTIVGAGTFMLAKFPEATLTPVMYYVRIIPDFDLNDNLTEVLNPFSKCIATFVAKKAMLVAQDPQQFEDWSKEWKDTVVAMMSAADPRDSSTPQFAADFWGPVEM